MVVGLDKEDKAADQGMALGQAEEEGAKEESGAESEQVLIATAQFLSSSQCSSPRSHLKLTAQ